MFPAYDLAAVRREFPIAERMTYLNHAGISPLPRRTQRAMHATIDWLACDPSSFSPGKQAENPFATLLETFSAEIARYINAADPTEIVGVTSTSTALNAVAQAIDWQPGDNVIFSEVEFPSNVYPWMVLERRGVEHRMAPADNGGATVAAFDPLVDDRTRVIAVSAVQYLSGHRTDLAAFGQFCCERGILFVVDAIQAIGHMTIDAQALGIDALASGGQKSLMGPPGQGFLYVRSAKCAEMRPGIVGPNAVANYPHWAQYDLTPREGAYRFMMGTTNTPGMAGAIESVRFLRELGPDRIGDWTRHLSQVAIEDLTARGFAVLTPTDPTVIGPIVTFRVGDADDLGLANTQADRLLAELSARRIQLAKHLDKRGAPHLRISTHCYNTEEDVRRVGAMLETLL